MKNQKVAEKQPYSDWDGFKNFLISRIKEKEAEQEKAEQKIILKEVEEAVKGKEITIDKICP